MYKFETTECGITEKAIHLLRNRYNYETIEFKNIDKIKISRGRQIKNWIVSLLIGCFLTSFGLFTGYKVIYEFFFADNFNNFHIEQLLIPYLPMAIGIYLIYISLKKGYVLELNSDNKIKKLPINDLTKKNKIEELKLFFSENSFTNNKFEK